MTAYNQRR